MATSDLNPNNVQCPRGSDCDIEHLKDRYSIDSWSKSKASSLLVTYEFISSATYMEEEHRIHDVAKEVLKLRHKGYRLGEAMRLATQRVQSRGNWAEARTRTRSR